MIIIQNVIEKEVCIHGDIGIVSIERNTTIRNNTDISPSTQEIDETGSRKSFSFIDLSNLDES